MPEVMNDPVGRGGEPEQSLSVKKAVSILRCFSHAVPERSLADIVRETGLPRTVCSRLLVTLEQEGLLNRDADTSQYRIAMPLFQMGSVALANVTVRSAATPVLSELSRRTSDTVCLVVEHGRSAICIDRIDGDFPIQQTALTMGKTMALHVGGAPFVLLSHMSSEHVEAVLREPLPRFTPSTVVDPIKIRKRIERVRKIGYAVGDEDAIEYLVAIGVPIFGYSGRVVAAFSVGGLKQRYPKDRIEEVAKLAIAAGEEISTRLGRSAMSVASLSA